MTPPQAASATASAISALASRFMLDGATYAKGGELGFEGFGFYAAGRGGVLGDVDADVVAAALVFFNPDTIRPIWDSTAKVLPRRKAALAFAQCGHEWGRTHFPDDLDVARLAALAGKVSHTASPAGAPVFAGWRALPEPADPKGAALHHMNALRELRMAHHAAAVLAAGVAPGVAVRTNSPHMSGLFGWPDPLAEDGTGDWDAIGAATDRLFGRALAALDDAERDEFVALANAASDATG